MGAEETQINMISASSPASLLLIGIVRNWAYSQFSLQFTNYPLNVEGRYYLRCEISKENINMPQMPQ